MAACADAVPGDVADRGLVPAGHPLRSCVVAPSIDLLYTSQIFDFALLWNFEISNPNSSYTSTFMCVEYSVRNL